MHFCQNVTKPDCRFSVTKIYKDHENIENAIFSHVYVLFFLLRIFSIPPTNFQPPTHNPWTDHFLLILRSYHKHYFLRKPFLTCSSRLYFHGTRNPHTLSTNYDEQCYCMSSPALWALRVEVVFVLKLSLVQGKGWKYLYIHGIKWRQRNQSGLLIISLFTLILNTTTHAKLICPVNFHFSRISHTPSHSLQCSNWEPWLETLKEINNLEVQQAIIWSY